MSTRELTTPRAWSARLIVGRLVFTATLVLAVTELANIVGPGWAGVLSAFPVALYPLVLLVHREYGPAPAQTILVNFPYGLWSVIAYALTVSIAYPLYGVIWGTLLGFANATAVLAIMWTKPLLLYLKSPGQKVEW